MPNEHGQVMDEDYFAPVGKLRIIKEDGADGDVSIVGDFDEDPGRAKFSDLMEFEGFDSFTLCNENGPIEGATICRVLQSPEIASANGWVYVGFYPQPNQPMMLHNGFVSRGFEVADLVFDDKGTRVNDGQYALWVKMGENPRLANCGCVNHAEERRPCKHDIQLALKR